MVDFRPPLLPRWRSIQDDIRKAQTTRRMPRMPPSSITVTFDSGAFLMAARIHFSGLGAEVNYVAPYPGHRTDSARPLLTNALKIVAGSLNVNYLDDLIIRHTDAQKSQALRNSGQVATHENQLRTIRLRRDPVRTGPQAIRYKSPSLTTGKRVLIVDDICTQGSFEAARAFIQATGATAVGVAWLKTPNNSYNRIASLNPEIRNPYSAYNPKRRRCRQPSARYGYQE